MTFQDYQEYMKPIYQMYSEEWGYEVNTGNVWKYWEWKESQQEEEERQRRIRESAIPLFTTTELAKRFDWSANNLNVFLRSFGLIEQAGKKWKPSSELDEKYYKKIYTKYGRDTYYNGFKWTEDGVQFVIDFLGKKGIKPIKPIKKQVKSNHLKVIK